MFGIHDDIVQERDELRVTIKKMQVRIDALEKERDELSEKIDELEAHKQSEDDLKEEGRDLELEDIVEYFNQRTADALRGIQVLHDQASIVEELRRCKHRR